MTTLTLPRLSSPRSIAAELVDRQPLLARYGLALLLIALVTGAAQLFDPRTVDGVNTWVKPTKFLVSVGVFALTAAWFFGYVRPERRNARMLGATVWTLVVTGSLELLWIGWQASQGLASHFNDDSVFHQVMYGMMGIWAVLLIGTTLPLAWEVARRPAPGLRADFVAAGVIGLLLTFLLGGALGGYMSAQPGHSVGAESNGLPLFGWNGIGGDLRVAHFMGIHAEQAIPIMAALVAGMTERTRWQLIVGGAALWTTVTLLVFAQAVAGMPLLPS